MVFRISYAVHTHKTREITKMTDVPDWDTYFMSMIYLIAMRSKDRNTHIGAVIVGPDNEIRSTGYNSFPRDVYDAVESRQIAPEKYYWIEHAERNAIYNAARIGTALKGCRMYTNGLPCMDCARGVIQAGITTVIVDKRWHEGNGEKWVEHAKRSEVMLTEAGVKIKYYVGDTIENIVKWRKGEVYGLQKG